MNTHLVGTGTYDDPERDHRHTGENAPCCPTYRKELHAAWRQGYEAACQDGKITDPDAEFAPCPYEDDAPALAEIEEGSP